MKKNIQREIDDISHVWKLTWSEEGWEGGKAGVLGRHQAKGVVHFPRKSSMDGQEEHSGKLR